MFAIFYDIITSLSLGRSPLEWVALIVVLCLFSSPGVMFTMVGLGAKVGFIQHIKEKLFPPLDDSEA
jgi:hypothetical protein